MAFSRFYHFAADDCSAPIYLDAVSAEVFYPGVVVVGCHSHGGHQDAYSRADDLGFAAEDAPIVEVPVAGVPDGCALAEGFPVAGARSVVLARLAAIYSEDIYDDVLFRAWASDDADYPAECLGSGLVEP